MRPRIKELRDAIGMKQSELAYKMGLHAVSMSRLETGATKISEKRLRQLMDIFNVSANEILTEQPPTIGIKQLKVIGAVEAGALRESFEWDPSDQYTTSLPIPDTYQMVKPFALEVHGPSMNLKYPEGTLLVCANIYNLNEEPLPGKRYVVEKIFPDGTREATVKQLRIDDDGKPWLWPESSHPGHQSPIAVNGNDGETIRILARVLGSYQPET